MNRSIWLLLFITFTTGLQCGKDNDSHTEPPAAACNGLVTDTTITGDQKLIVIPNAFTPDGDINNEVYRSVYAYNNVNKLSAIDFNIFNAGGNILFHTQTFGNGWKPTNIYGANQTFYYRLQANTKGGHNIGMCGEVHVLTCMPHDSLPYFYFEDQVDPNGGFVLPTAEKLPGCS